MGRNTTFRTWDDLDKIQTVGEGFKKQYIDTIFLEEKIPIWVKIKSKKLNKNSIISEKVDTTCFV